MQKTYQEIAERFAKQYWDGTNSMTGYGVHESNGEYSLEALLTADEDERIPNEFEGVKVIKVNITRYRSV